MNILISLIIMFLFWGFLFKILFGVIGLAFKIVFGVAELVFCILGAIFGGGLFAVLGFAFVGSLLFLPILFLSKKR